jgi:hypothetical protein
LCICSKATSVTRVYQIREEAGENPTAILEFKLNGELHAVSGNGNRVIVLNALWFEIHGIAKDASHLVCEFGGFFASVR